MTHRLTRPPSVDAILQWPAIRALVSAEGHDIVLECVRHSLDALRVKAEEHAEIDGTSIVEAVETRLEALKAPSLKRVFNLTGTVLHTNLGRAPLPPEAIEAMAEAARGAVNLEYDLASGKRGDRNAHVAGWITRLTGAEAALVVNNNAAAVLLTLNTLASRKQVPVSRGELIEIGGAFRMPDIMARAGCKLVEVGTTNRTHRRDFEQAINERTALLMKVHTSNYVIEGFTASVSESALAELAHARSLPLVVDLGSGTLVDLTRFGLPPEPTVSSAIAAGADLVTFSGDKLLGGPQAGIIAGRADLVRRLARNPMTRALRLDKMTLAALSAVLRLYADPERLAERLPSLRLMARGEMEIRRVAELVRPAIAERLGRGWSISVASCHSQVGSGALPVGALPSVALVMTPEVAKKRRHHALATLARAFRALRIPVIGRVHDEAFWLDLRCLDDEPAFLGQLGELRLS